VTYYNDGDWVESCTALVEDATGAMTIIDWAAETARLAPVPAAAASTDDASDKPVREKQSV